MDLQSILGGFIASGLSTVVGHPIDTWKSLRQGNRCLTMDIYKLYSGVTVPILTRGLRGAMVFNVYNSSREYKGIYAGVVAGVVTAPITNTFDIFKTVRQIYPERSYITIWRNCRLKDGIMWSMLRDGLFYGVYYPVYHKMRKKEIHPIIAGGVSGILGWTISYPFDTLRVNKQIRNKVNIGRLYSGLSFALLRAFPVHAVNLWTLERLGLMK
jgi:hypothetical protein